MARDAIVFACANPNPEIWPWDAKEAGARIVATGRSDFNNQLNNSLVFPGIFRGTLDSRAVTISDEMALAAAMELAKCAEEHGLSEEAILPTMADWRRGSQSGRGDRNEGSGIRLGPGYSVAGRIHRDRHAPDSGRSAHPAGLDAGGLDRAHAGSRDGPAVPAVKGAPGKGTGTSDAIRSPRQTSRVCDAERTEAAVFGGFRTVSHLHYRSRNGPPTKASVDFHWPQPHRHRTDAVCDQPVHERRLQNRSPTANFSPNFAPAI